MKSNFMAHETVICDDREILEEKTLLTTQKYLFSGKKTKVFEQSETNK